MAERQYVFLVWNDTRIRHYHRTQRQRVVGFCLQLEVEVEGAWQAGIRYDTAHGFAHIDRFTMTGKRRRERLRLEYAEALTGAEGDLGQNWSVYRERFLSGGIP